MSELRIRSEAVSDDTWAQPFLPPASRGPEAEDEDADFGPLLAAAAREMAALLGMPVTVRPNPPGARMAAGGGLAALSGALASLRLGGDPGRGGAVTGAALGRHAAAIAAALEAASAAHWPAGCGLPGFDIDIVCEAAHGQAVLRGPPRAVPPPPVALMRLARDVLELPMRVRVELAAEMRMIGSLLPLRTGQVLAISPSAEMPLIIGRHSIGRATVTAQADGRQHAEIIAIGVDEMGGRA